MSQEQEKTSKVENEEFIKSIVVFIHKTKPKSTTAFVEAGLFKNRSEGRKILREIAEKGIITMEKPEKGIKKYSYTLPPANNQPYDSEKKKKPKKEQPPPEEEIPEKEIEQ